MKKTVRTIHIGLTEREAKVVEKIEETSFLAEVIRELIRKYGNEHFPPDPGYVQVKKEELELKRKQLEFDQQPNEVYVRKNFHMKVKDDVIYSMTFGNLWTTPLSEARKIKPADKLVTRHLRILKAFEEMQPIVENEQVKMTMHDLEELRAQWEALGN